MSAKELEGREKWLADARAVLDLIEANPGLPVNDFKVSVSVDVGGDDENRDVIDQAAFLLGVEAGCRVGSTHYSVTKTIGGASYRAYMVPDQAMADYRARQELGEKALAAVKAKAQADRLAVRLTHKSERVNEDLVVCAFCTAVNGTHILWPCLAYSEAAVAEDVQDEDQPATPARGHGQDVVTHYTASPSATAVCGDDDNHAHGRPAADSIESTVSPVPGDAS